MMWASTRLLSGYFSSNPFSPNVRGNFCQALTISASALNGVWPASSKCDAANSSFSGNVFSTATVLIALPPRSRQPPASCPGSARGRTASQALPALPDVRQSLTPLSSPARGRGREGRWRRYSSLFPHEEFCPLMREDSSPKGHLPPDSFIFRAPPPARPHS